MVVRHTSGAQYLVFPDSASGFIPGDTQETICNSGDQTCIGYCKASTLPSILSL